MSNNFKVKVNNTFHFDINHEDLSHIDVIKVSNSEFHVLQQNKSYKVAIIDANFNSKSYRVKINNNTYNVNISNALDLLIKDMGFNVSSTKNVNSIKAPMPGLILEIHVKVGQEVNEDDALLILEAMKMENIITSPRHGIVKSIAIDKGDAVFKNELLMEFEN